ncbi:MAG: rod shape-determining protein MreC [Candidatus Omnitrophica bacterium]|nr:rod shape-determining protein MreC [Candidatus Omnitrophota bacterium]
MFKVSKRNLKYVFAAAALIFLIPYLISLFSSPIQKIVQPPLSIFTLLQREVRGLFFYHRNYLENERLRNENYSLRIKFSEFKELYQENSRLKKLLSFKQKSVYKLIAVRVIARAPDNWSFALLVDKGRRNGINKGMVVINYRGLVGKVAEVSDDTSKIVLINDPSLGISGIVQRSRQEGLVNGTLGSNLIMRYLPEDADVLIGDTVVTSELSKSYPKGLIIGSVVNLGKEFSGLSRYAVIRPAAQLSNLEELLVIAP